MSYSNFTSLTEVLEKFNLQLENQSGLRRTIANANEQLKVQGQTLDFDYLFQWAETLDLPETLSQAIVAAGLTTKT